MSVKIAGIEFENVTYDSVGDVLYLHVGDPGSDAHFDASKEGHALSYAADGSLVGMTILNARWLLEQDGKIVITLPEQRIEARDLGDVLVPA
jgi:uncharacterized protein YuzE